MSNMGTIARNTQKYGNAERMETGDGKARSSPQPLPSPEPRPLAGRLKVGVAAAGG